MIIRVESTASTALATCDSCPPWRVLRGSRTAALTAAAVHAELTHGDTRLANKLRERAARIEATRREPPG